MDSDSDEEDTFVTLGTAVDVPDSDAPLKKPVSFQDVQVKDSKGRPRFHGAFTGGFSAGYFNTVGTQEGWTPSTFVSSRQDRFSTQSTQRPEDFMDEEDLGEYGIAPRKYVTSSTFASEERKKRRYDEAKLATSDTTLLGSSALLNLIIPERITVGVKLLRKMGWKEGQGIGPRMKKHHRKSKENKKVYGCELPSSDSDEGLDDESMLTDMTFAPKDSAHILLNVKDNTKGLGYRGLDPSKALPSSHINLFHKPIGGKTGRKGIRGQAFGVGALEDEDDDIYTVDDKSNYDMTMVAEDEDETFGWTGSKSKGQRSTPVGYVGKLLEEFKLSSVKLVQKKDYPPPKLPPNFRPIHVFVKSEDSTLSMSGSSGVDYRQFIKPQDSHEDPSTASSDTHQQPSQRKQANDAVSRSVAFGEQPFVALSQRKQSNDTVCRSMVLGEENCVGSIFDLIPKDDKEKMEKVKSGVSIEKEDGNKEQDPPNTQAKPTVDGKRSGTEPHTSNMPLHKGGAIAIQPFKANPAKQARYEKYLTSIKQGQKDPYNTVAESDQTEWEIERERDEFAQAARLFKPLATMMAMRFTSAGTEDKPVDTNTQDELSEPAKAAAMKMYGKLTREVIEWHPDKLLCKRFNVPDPYPGSNIVGLASLKRDKYSVFNFLTFANPTEADRSQSNRDNITEQADDRDNNSRGERKDNSNEVSGKKDDTNERTKSSSSGDKVTNNTSKPGPSREMSRSIHSRSMSGVKSIFTHLVNPAKSVDSGKSKTGVSFNIKTKGPQKPPESSSVFGDEGGKGETASGQRRELPKLEDVFESSDGQQQGNKKSSEKDKSDMDLFRAIFKNTDSESSSEESDDNEENTVTKSTEVTEVSQVDSVSNTVTPGNVDGTKDRMETDAMDVQLETVKKNHDSLNVPSATGVLPGSGERIPSINERLSPVADSDDSDSYGPALPPPSNTGGVVNRLSSGGEGYIDLTTNSGRKHKHKHKDKHKSKKDKKNKSKKSKHKKKHKKGEKKTKKSKDRRKSDTDSSDTTDKDTDSEMDVPSDKDLLNKLKQLKPGQRMRAADMF